MAGSTQTDSSSVSGSSQTNASGTADDRRRRVSEAAYYRSERRGFAPGQEEEDWLEAEKEIDDGEGRLRPEDNTYPSPK